MRNVLIGIVAVSVVCWVGGTAMAAHSDHGCSNCHVPHQSGDANDPAAYGVPLWSTAQNADGLPVFTLYSSQTFDQLGTDISQPDGPSKMCLGCHDGSYSHVADRWAIFEPGDLARSHPISFTYDSGLASRAGPGLRDPASAMSGFGGTIAEDLLDAHGKMQCTSCHDIHLTGIGQNMLRWDYDADEGTTMCRTCHNK